MEHIIDKLHKDNVTFVNLQFTDILGTLKEVTIPVSKIEDSLKYGTWFDGSSIEGFARIHESDLYLKPDVSTYAIIPWLSNGEEKTARFICDIYKPDGNPFEADPRFVLKKAIEYAKSLGFQYNLGPEVEFFLFTKEGNGPLPIDNRGYFDLAGEYAQQIMRDIAKNLEYFDIDVEAIHHEVATGQFEVDFRYGDALITADRVLTLRSTVKAIAQRYNLIASFMPKPIMGINGSGMHVHQSLFDINERRNAFFDGGDKYNLSKVAYSFIAGQLAHIKEICGVLCPTVNSYKRLVAGYEAPVYISWARINRSALIRIPKWFEDKKESARIELRCPDPSANPYLAFALMLSAGLDGVKNNLQPPNPVEEDLYHFDDIKLREFNIETLPSSLYEAIQFLKNSELCKQTFGDVLFRRYIRIKEREWNEFKLQVTEWEVEKYLDI
ncbi:MAG: glutamine synthetase family protein [Ignavibacteria bacterium]|nr:glutamine synthetase family protein [Ignavibacteria bacterium]